VFLAAGSARGADWTWRSTLGKEPVVPDQFDVNLEDSDLLTEVELVADLMVAATETDGHLSQDQIDTILGVVVPSPRAPG
jgi:hypothetical protein